jgi:hypothetical protein
MRRSGRRGRWSLAPFFLALLFTTIPDDGTSDIDTVSGLGPPVAESCPLCDESLRVPIVPLGRSDLDDLTDEYARSNEHRLAEIDSMYRSGAFGLSDRDEAGRRAHLLSRLATLNNYRLLAHYACDSTRVYEASESTLADVCARYADPSLVAIASLRRLRLGLGRVCAIYDVSPGVEGETILGGKALAYHTEEAKLAGQKRRVLSLKLPTGTDDVVDVLLAHHYSCAIEHSFLAGPPAPYELFLVYDIQGGWLRKWGTHRPTAFMFWVSPENPYRLALPQEPLVGVRIYIPHLRFRLPSILPDINLDDLREVELPQPIVPISYLIEKRFPQAWLVSDDGYGFEHWVGHGDVPPAMRERFPDR